MANLVTGTASTRPVRTRRGAQLVIPLPDDIDAAAVSSLSESVAKALQAVLKQGSQALIERASAVAIAAVQIATPSLELIDEHMARRRTLKRIVDETRWYSAEQIRQQFRKRLSPTVDWKRRGKIFGVQIEDREFFAAWQFGQDLKPVPIVGKVLAALGPIADSWKIAAWFHFPNPRLAKRVGHRMLNRAPKDCLDEGELLIEAARQRDASYVA